jgi:hypothetical protein
LEPDPDGPKNTTSKLGRRADVHVITRSLNRVEIWGCCIVLPPPFTKHIKHTILLIFVFRKL